MPSTIGYDIETSYDGDPRPDAQKHPEENFICGFSLTNSLAWARAVPIAFESGPNIDLGVAAKCLRRLAEARDADGKPLLVPHNAVFELRCTARLFALVFGIPLEDAYFEVRSDTMVEAYIEAAHESYALKSLTWETFGHKMTEIMELFGDGLTKKQQDSIQFHLLDQASPAVVDYMCEDALWTLKHHLLRYPKVTDPEFRGAFLFKVDMGQLPVICAMSDTGIAYDWNRMREAAQRGQAFMARLAAEINASLADQLGRPVSLSLASPAQIAEGAVRKDEGLGLPVKRRSKKTGKPSTDKLAVKQLAGEHPVVKKIQDYRRIKRLCMDNYAGKYEQDYDYAPDGRAHPNILACAAVTGRFAFSRPAAQQPPKKVKYQLDSGETFEFAWRDCITAPPPGAMGDDEGHGWYILGFDLSQAELRAMAGEAQEPALLEAYANGVDVHKLTASKMLGILLEQVTKEQRDSVGKLLNLALQYQLSAPSLAERMGVPKAEGQRLYDAWFDGYPRIKAWTEATVAKARRDGYTMSRFGRKHPIWEFAKTCSNEKCGRKWLTPENRCSCGWLGIPRSNAVIAHGERLAGNAPIQGCLPADTRVLTWRGWVPVGEFESPESVWTGAEWASAERLDMGEAPRLRLHLSDGRTFDCDNRHKLLVTDAGPWPQWCPVTDSKGRVLARDESKDWGLPDYRSAEDWYWIGRFTGDGCLWSRKSGHVMWKMAFHRTKEAQDIKRFLRWVEGKPWNTAHSPKGYYQCRERKDGWSVTGQTVPARDWWLEVGGFRTGKGGVQEVPPEVFTLDLKRREAFLQGRVDADGYRRGFRADHGRQLRECDKVGTVSLTAAQDLCRLASTVGMTGRVCGPYVMHGRGTAGQPHQIYELYFHKQIAPLTVERVEELGITEPMFTLSVMHPRHAFSSEGLISKNSATGDYMRIAQIRAGKALRKAGLAGKVRLFLNVHDSLDFYVRKDVPPGEVIRVLQSAVVFPVEGWPEVVADWHAGTRMGSLAELEVSPDFSVSRKGIKEEALVSGDPDDEDEVELPAVDIAAVRAVAGGHNASVPDESSGGRHCAASGDLDSGSGVVLDGADRRLRTVIISVPQVPDKQAAGLLRALAARLPGPNTVILRAEAYGGHRHARHLRADSRASARRGVHPARRHCHL